MTAEPSVLSAPVTDLTGVGDKLANTLAKLQIRKVEDLLFHLPLRYEDRTALTPIGALRAGAAAQIEGEVELTEVSFRGRRTLLCRLSDGTGSVLLRFFHFSNAQRHALVRGLRIRCYGEVRRGASLPEMIHPEYAVLGDDAPPLPGSLTPIYPVVNGIQQTRLRKLIQQALSRLSQDHRLRELLPASAGSLGGAQSLAQAIRYLHQPPAGTQVRELLEKRHPAVQRLAFEELVAYRLALLGMRAQFRSVHAPILTQNTNAQTLLYAQFGFEMTAAQQRVIEEIAHDLKSPEPMLRLVQGDVGAGKTVVAAAAAQIAISNGFQVAVMAPTEILAEQHLANFNQWFSPMNVGIAWLTGKLTAAKRRTALAAIENGDASIIVGTHALFQDEVAYRTLGLSIIDEQHRFGVDQRMALRDKGRSASGQHSELRPHQLTLSATPIPRTLAMTAYADLDCSVLDELPPGRTPVTTVAMSNARREEIISRVSELVADGRQAYWVCTLIEESETLQCKTAEDTYAQLVTSLPECRVGLVHGRLKSAEKDAVMQAFKRRELDLLVATTVIEVGVDVANATLMVIENAERLGLSQLHQLRGRIGRGSAGGSCVLLYQPKLTQAAHARIAILRETNDGFLIAERDLELRGAGEVLGTQQAGDAQFRIADLSRDADLLDDVKSVADAIQRDLPQNVPDLVRRWRGEQPKYREI
ncbi:MAG: ATP-dependent DNA helicase RecG [Pseudomonadota bacterium]